MFSSNLGARAVQCNPQDVSGTQRYRFFATALTNQKEALVLKRRARKRQQASSFSTNKNKTTKSRNKNHNNCSSASFVNSGTQTDEVKVKIIPTRSLDSQENDCSKDEIPKVSQVSQIELEKIAREVERKAQEAALPPVTDKESLEAYRIFLEENERKDFALREKELDEMMKEKLKRIEEDLHNRYKKENETNQNKIDLIRESKLASLKEKQSQSKRERILDILNRKGQSLDKMCDLKTNTTNSSRVSTVFPIRRKNQVRKAQEDLDLVTSYFDTDEFDN